MLEMRSSAVLSALSVWTVDNKWIIAVRTAEENLSNVRVALPPEIVRVAGGIIADLKRG